MRTVRSPKRVASIIIEVVGPIIVVRDTNREQVGIYIRRRCYRCRWWCGGRGQTALRLCYTGNGRHSTELMSRPGRWSAIRRIRGREAVVMSLSLSNSSLVGFLLSHYLSLSLSLILSLSASAVTTINLNLFPN